MTYEEIKHKYKNAELLVSKANIGFIEKMLDFYDNDLDHDSILEVIHSKRYPRNVREKKVKNYHDAYNYLLNNHMNNFNNEVLRRFFFLIKGKEYDNDIIDKIKFFYVKPSKKPLLEKSISLHLYVYELLSSESEEFRTMVSLMIFNQRLCSLNISPFRLQRVTLEEYIDVRNGYLSSGDEIPMIEFFLEQIINNKPQPKSYYKNVKTLHLSEIFGVLNSEKAFLNNLGITSLSIYGSFAKGTQRIDSDIDLLVNIVEDLSFEERKVNIETIKIYLFSKFNRYVDIQEVSEFVVEFMIPTVKFAIKIF